MHCTSCDWQKGTSRDKATLNSEEIKPVATSIVELRLAEGISEWICEWISEGVSIVFNKLEIFKFHKNLLEGFRVTLKAFLGLAKSNHQYSQAVFKEDWGWFLGNIVGWKSHILHDPCYTVQYYRTVWYSTTILYDKQGHKGTSKMLWNKKGHLCLKITKEVMHL